MVAVDIKCRPVYGFINYVVTSRSSAYTIWDATWVIRTSRFVFDEPIRIRRNMDCGNRRRVVPVFYFRGYSRPSFSQFAQYDPTNVVVVVYMEWFNFHHQLFASSSSSFRTRPFVLTQLPWRSKSRCERECSVRFSFVVYCDRNVCWLFKFISGVKRWKW